MVYVVCWSDYDEHWIKAIYLDEKEANKACKRFKAEAQADRDQLNRDAGIKPYLLPGSFEVEPFQVR